jgi:hypothetical protein
MTDRAAGGWGVSEESESSEPHCLSPFSFSFPLSVSVSVSVSGLCLCLCVCVSVCA